MARIRSVKPELRTSDLVASWPMEMRYFWVLLWGYLDDKGRGLDVPKQIAGDCFPHDDHVTAAKVVKWLDQMMLPFKGRPGPICRYKVDGRRYLHSLNWGEHQKPNRPTPSRLPPCPLHEALTEEVSEPDTEPPSGDSVPGIRQQGSSGVRSSGAVEQQARGVSGSHAVGATRLVQQNIPIDFPSAVRTSLAIQVGELSREYDEDVLAEALVLWRGKTNVGPGVLPSLVSDVVKRRNGHARAAPRAADKPSTTDARVAQAQALKAQFAQDSDPFALPAGGTR